MIRMNSAQTLSLAGDLLVEIEAMENLYKEADRKNKNDATNLRSRHNKERNELAAAHRTRQSEIRERASATVGRAKRIYSEIEKLDSTLLEADRYYGKTKRNKEEELISTPSERLAQATDLFDELATLSESYERIANHYASAILPSLINGIHYLFSSKRKADYEELIVLKHAMRCFVEEAEKTMPELADEALKEEEFSFAASINELEQLHKREQERQRRNASQLLESCAESCQAKLEEIAPSKTVQMLNDIWTRYRTSLADINISNTIIDNIVSLNILALPVSALCADARVETLVKSHLTQLIDQQILFLPIITFSDDSSVWSITPDSTGLGRNFALAALRSYLSCLPIGTAEFYIVDPVGSGRSVSPLGDLFRKAPFLLPKGIAVSKDSISDLLEYLREGAEETEYSELDNEKRPKLLILFDFPRGFDERSLSDLSDLVEMSSSAGIHVICILAANRSTQCPPEFEYLVKRIIESSERLTCASDSLLLRGLPLGHAALPNRQHLSEYVTRYLLLFDKPTGGSVACPPKIRRLLTSKDRNDCQTILKSLESDVADIKRARSELTISSEIFPSVIRVGTLRFPRSLFPNGMCPHAVNAPLEFNINAGMHIELMPDPKKRGDLAAVSQCIMWTFLRCTPVTKGKLIIFDVNGRGLNAGPFLDLRRAASEAFEDSIVTDGESMREKLHHLNEYIDDTIQNKLAGRFASVREYNKTNTRRSLPLRLLVVFDYPYGFDERSLRDLKHVIANGGPCGVQVLLCRANNTTQLGYGCDALLDDISSLCTNIVGTADELWLEPAHVLVQLIPSLNQAEAKAFAGSYTCASNELMNRGLSFSDLISQNLFSENSARQLCIPIGIGEGDSIVNLILGTGSSHHALVAGATGSGKSTLLHTIILSSMLRYAPDQLNLYLMDFKGGTEFKVYDGKHLPHIKLLALDAVQEFGESILERLVAELEERSRLFKLSGVANLKDYAAREAIPLPRILVLIDEFQILFNEATNRKVAFHCAELAKRIVTEGRSYGIHLIMATQSTKVLYDLAISRGTLEQMRTRIALKCGADDTRYLFGDRNERKALEMMPGPIGTAVMNPEYMEDSCIGFRVAYCDDELRQSYLEKISDVFADISADTLSFEGGNTTSLEAYFRQYGRETAENSPLRIPLGELVKVAPPLVLQLDRRRRHNLLVCGSDENMTSKIVTDYIEGALLDDRAEVFCIDCDILTGGTALQGFYDELSSSFSERFHSANSEYDLFDMIDCAWRSFEAHRAGSSAQTVVILKDIQFAEQIQSMLAGNKVDESAWREPSTETLPNNDSASMDDGDAFDPFASITSYFAEKERTSFSTSLHNNHELTCTEKLQTMIENGSTYGVYLVVTSLDYQSIDSSMRYGVQTLSKFPERIVFSLGDNDAYRLVEGVSTVNLRNNMVLYSDGVKSPYQAIPFEPMTIDSLIRLKHELANDEDNTKKRPE